MKTALSVMAVILASAGALFAIVVPVAALLTNRRLVLRGEDRHVSVIPVIGSIAGCVAHVLLPIGTLNDRLAWAWAPLALEALVFGAGVACWKLSGLEDASERLRRARRE